MSILLVTENWQLVALSFRKSHHARRCNGHM